MQLTVVFPTIGFHLKHRKNILLFHFWLLLLAEKFSDCPQNIDLSDDLGGCGWAADPSAHSPSISLKVDI